MNLLLAVAVLALMTFTGTAVYVVRAVLLYKTEAAKPVFDPVEPEKLNSVLIDINDRIDKLTLAVSDGIERVHRAESRIAKTVTSARRVVREAGLEHAGIEAEYEELQQADDPGIEALPAMPEEVAGTRTIRIPGGELMIGVA